MSHGDAAMDSEIDFPMVSESRLIPARIWNECSKLRKSRHSICLGLAHVSSAGARLVSLMGAPVYVPSFATAEFESCWHSGRVLHAVVPLGCGLIFRIFGIYGYQGADNDPEKLAVTEKLFQATLAESEAVGSNQPVRIAGDFNVLPSKIPCVSNMVSAGGWVDLEASFAHMKGRKPAVTCKTSWVSNRGTSMDFILACPLAHTFI